jgi:hypothetical protein
MTLHHWWFALDGPGRHCDTCPCTHGYADIGRDYPAPTNTPEDNSGRHYRCRWVHPAEFERLEATYFLLEHLIT